MQPECLHFIEHYCPLLVKTEDSPRDSRRRGAEDLAVHDDSLPLHSRVIFSLVGQDHRRQICGRIKSSINKKALDVRMCLFVPQSDEWDRWLLRSDDF